MEEEEEEVTVLPKSQKTQRLKTMSMVGKLKAPDFIFIGSTRSSRTCWRRIER